MEIAMPEEVSPKDISEVALKMFSADEVLKMSENSQAALARRVQWMLEDGVKFDQKTLNETRASLEQTALHPALAPLPNVFQD